MIRYQNVNSEAVSSAVRDFQAHYGTQTAVTKLPQPEILPFSQRQVERKRSFEETLTASINTLMVVNLYNERLRDIEAKLNEWQRAVEERWEQLEMEMGVERDIIFVEPEVPTRIIKAIVHNCGPAPVPDFLFDDFEE